MIRIDSFVLKVIVGPRSIDPLIVKKAGKVQAQWEERALPRWAGFSDSLELDCSSKF